MVINTSAHNTSYESNKYGVTLAMMSSHAASRPACAPIQGLVVNTVPSSDPRCNPKYDSIYNHGYGEPAGTQGINCHHELFPYIEGVTTNPFTHPNTEEEIKKGKIQQKQRDLERRIRDDKKSLKYTKDLKDVGGSYKHKNLLNRHRSELLNLVNDNSFLHRDYKREKIATELSDKKKKDIRFSIKSDEAYLRQLKEKFGRHGLPDNRRLIYNKGISKHAKVVLLSPSLPIKISLPGQKNWIIELWV